MNRMDFTFSDLIAGYVTDFDREKRSLTVRTTDGRDFQVRLTATTYAQIVRNLREPYADCTAQLPTLLVPGRYLYVYGVFYPERGSLTVEASYLVLLGRTEGDYRFELPDWWINQIRALGDFYLGAQFEGGEMDFRNYRTGLSLSGAKRGDVRQETDTISRLVYGFATAFLMTGDERYLEGAEKGTEYLRDHMRYYDVDEDVVYWYHGIDIDLESDREEKIFSSEFGDDYDAIPAYEQIYALAGPLQTYRATGDPRILRDAELTLKLFDNFFLDRQQGGYFSHLDPITLDPRSEALGRNRGRKNWNSVGDHAPAYLINLWLATGSQRHLNMLAYTADIIEARFQDYQHSPFVQERFHEDWSPDCEWGWQQNRAVVGHNLKIAWNLMRIHHIRPSDKYVALARRIADIMPAVGSDQQRGGWYDVMERTLLPGQERHRFTWHDRKAWWQQEQVILAYLILAGSLKEERYHRLAREAAAYYSAFFLDHDDGGIYFNTLANGIPFLVGTERLKGSHSMSGYHSFELCYLAQVYTNLLLTGDPMDLHFKPQPDGFRDGVLRVQPDILPPGSVRLAGVWVDGDPYTKYDPDQMTVLLPQSSEALPVRVRIEPTPAP